jgi:hypothetical protein
MGSSGRSLYIGRFFVARFLLQKDVDIFQVKAENEQPLLLAAEARLLLNGLQYSCNCVATQVHTSSVGIQGFYLFP